MARGVTARDTLKSSRHMISQHARRRRQRIARAARENNAGQVNDIDEEMGAGRRQRVQVRVQLRGSGERGAERWRRGPNRGDAYSAPWAREVDGGSDVHCGRGVGRVKRGLHARSAVRCKARGVQGAVISNVPELFWTRAVSSGHQR